MKRSFKAFIFIALAAMTAAGCSKEEPVPVASRTHRVTIYALQEDTKTLIEEGVSSAAFRWSADDASRFVVRENANQGTNVSISSEDSYETMSLSATFANTPAADYTYSAFLAKNWTDDPTPKPYVPSTQVSTSISYDPDADILVAEPQVFGSVQDALSLRFGRPVVINKMTLKGLTVGHTVSSVTVSADKSITGSYDYENNSWSGLGDEIVISTNQVVPASGQVTVYFVTMPVDDVTLSVNVTTASYTYSKSFSKTISFKQNQVTVFGVSGLNKEVIGRRYVKVNSLSEITEGSYIIVNGGYYLPNAEALSGGPSKSAVTVSDNIVTGVSNGMIWNFSGSTSSMTIQSGANASNYLIVASTSNNNQVRVNTTSGKTWTIADYSGTAGAFTLKDNTYNRYCATYGDGSDWRSYNSYNAANYADGGRVYLYKLIDNRLPAGMSWSTGNVTASITNSGTIFTPPVLSLGNASSVSYSSSNSGVATIDAGGAVTILAPGQTEISAIFAANDDYLGATASYTLTVVDNREVYYRITSIDDLESGDYLIVYESGSLVFDGSLGTLDATSNHVAVTINNHRIAVSNEVDALKFVYNASNHTLKSASGYFIGQTSDANGIQTSTSTAYTNTISFSGNNVDIVSSGGAYLRYNSLAEQSRFRYYKSSTYTNMEAIQLYKKGVAPAGDSPAPGSLKYLVCTEIPTLSLANPGGYTQKGTETFGSTSWYEYDAAESTRKVVTHTYEYNGEEYRNYTSMVDQTRRCPLWVAYPMHKTAYPSNSLGRVGDFSTSTSYDPAIPRSWQSSGSTSDYNNGNGYARGHLCASADRQAIEAANEQTFYYTNQCPQWQNSFNSGVWSSLEGAVQSNAPTGSDTLYVVSGVLFEDDNYGPSNDGGNVGRPSHFYKCLMLCSFNGSHEITAARGCAYIYTNTAHAAGAYSDGETTIDEIEVLAGFDFFPNVPSSLQTNAENGTSKYVLN